MPGRFSNLEFDGEPRENVAAMGEQTCRKHDAADWLAQAEDAYRWGRFEQALRLYTRCLERDRAVIRAWVGQVQMLVQLGEHTEARLWSDKALELFRDNGELLAAKAQSCARLRDYRACLACSDASLQAPGSSPWRWEVRGEALLTRGQKHFDACFQRALSEKAADWFDRVVIARIYQYYGRTANALQHLRAAVELEPTHGIVWFEMGNCEAAMGAVGAARRSYERCLELRSDYVEASNAIAALRSVSFLGWLRRLLGWMVTV